jgi:hypothetical protein
VKNVAFKLIGTCFLTVHGANAPTDAEFEPFLALFKSCPLEHLRVLSFSLGGGPTAAQRRLVNEALRGQQIPVAIVTEARLVRGVVTAMSWFNKSQRAFAPEEMEEALTHVHVPRERHPYFISQLEKLREELDKDEPAPSARHVTIAPRRR